MAAQHIPPGASFAFDTAARALREQLDRIEAIDTKAGILIAADGVVAGLLLRREELLANVSRGLGIALIVGVTVSMLLAIVAFLIRRFFDVLVPSLLVPFMDRDEAWIKWRSLGSVVRAFGINARKLSRKARFLSAAMFAFLATVATVGGYLVWALSSDIGA